MGLLDQQIMEENKKGWKENEVKKVFFHVWLIKKMEEKIKKHTWNPLQTFLLNNAKKITEK